MVEALLWNFSTYPLELIGVLVLSVLQQCCCSSCRQTHLPSAQGHQDEEHVRQTHSLELAKLTVVNVGANQRDEKSVRDTTG